MNTFHRYSRVFAAAALCALGSTGAYAQATWDLDACVISGSCNGSGASATTSVTIAGYYASSATSKFTLGSLNNDGTNWMGVKSGGENTTAPNHAIDNMNVGTTGGGSPYELVFLQFSRAVDLTNVASTGYVGPGNADFQVWRWNGSSAPTLTDYQPNATATPAVAGSGMTGWTSVKSGDFELGSSQAISDGAYYSSYWLISTAFGGSDDAFKLGMVTAAASVCSGGASGSGGCAPTTPVPEPTSIAMVLLAGVAAASARRRRRA